MTSTYDATTDPFAIACAAGYGYMPEADGRHTLRAYDGSGWTRTFTTLEDVFAVCDGEEIDSGVDPETGLSDAEALAACEWSFEDGNTFASACGPVMTAAVVDGGVPASAVTEHATSKGYVLTRDNSADTYREYVWMTPESMEALREFNASGFKVTSTEDLADGFVLHTNADDLSPVVREGLRGLAMGVRPLLDARA